MNNFQRGQQQLFAKLPSHLASAVGFAPGLKNHLGGCDISGVNSPEMLAKLPILHKGDIMAAQAKAPPFAGFVNVSGLNGGRIFCSPGPIFEPEIEWGGEAALRAVGVGVGDIVHNCFSYHLTPGGFILDSAIRNIGAVCVAGGIGNSEEQVRAMASVRPSFYCGTPDYLKILLEKAGELKLDISSIRGGLVSGGALFPELRKFYAEKGIDVLQAYAVAEIGIIAYEVEENKPMVINENLIIEICDVGTGGVLGVGEVGEIVVTNFSNIYPLVRFATGDLSAIDEAGRLVGWLGRADERTKVKGMFIDPRQIGMLCKAENIKKARLVVTRKNDIDEMKLLVMGSDIDVGRVGVALKEITKISGEVEVVASLPNDGKLISDERKYGGTN